MSIKENKALVCRIYEQINQGDPNAFFKFCTPDYIEHMTDRDMSLEQARQFEAKYNVELTDINATINLMVAEGDKVAVLVTWRGTHKGTGQKREMTNANVFRITNKKCAELWNVTDIRLAQQLGVIPKR